MIILSTLFLPPILFPIIKQSVYGWLVPPLIWVFLSLYVRSVERKRALSR